MHNKPLVSIIMNCYNGEKYLKLALKSIIKQKYKNWELIFWDNKSTDKSKKIFKSFKDKRFRYFYAKRFTSLYAARNKAILRSKGQFISFLDADDLWMPNKLNLQIPLFKNKKVGVVYSKLYILNQSKNIKKIHVNKKLPEGNISKIIISNYNIGIITTIIRKNILKRLKKIFDNRFTHIGDFDLFVRLSKICEFKAAQLPTAIYRAHGKNLTTIEKDKAISEFEIWLKENKKNLRLYEVKKIKSMIDYKKLINYKLKDDYLNSFKILFNFKNFNLSIKNVIIFCLPSVILKKIFWY
ncbi:glycosyltransferase [Pelagibacteraceae bacterium]|nr:glycosyltransferase [Pelagibacteraceae bacterium]